MEDRATDDADTATTAITLPTAGRVLRRLFLLHWLAAIVLLGSFVAEVRWHGWPTLFFVGAVWLEYAALYLLPAFVPAFLLAWAARRWPGLRIAAIATASVLSAAVLLFLIVDAIVFRLYAFHVNGFVWNLLWTPGGIQSMDAGGKTYQSFALRIGGTIAFEWFALLVARKAEPLWRRLAPARPRRAAWIAALLFVAVAGGERLAFSFANLADYQPIISAHNTFPFYGRTRMRKFAGLFGLEQRKEARVEFDQEGHGLRYPLKPLEFAPDAKKWNVLWLVSESWRADTLNPTVMPAADAFADRALRFRNHFSGGNGTRMGVFSMFYGLYGAYWEPFLFAVRPPAVIDRMVDAGYQFSVSTSAKFSFPEFDKTIWARLPRSQLVEGEDSKRGWENDRALVTRLLTFLDQRDPAKPFFAFHFFESPHAQYWFPDESIIARPYCDEMDYATLGKEDMPKVKNRYLNAVHHLDSQLARIIDYLQQHQLLDSTLVVMTGDHGEEFMEHGRYGHHSTFSDEQIRTPLILSIPGVAPRSFDSVSSHLDLVPTLLHQLGAVNPPEEYCLGLDLLSSAVHDHVVIADYDHLCVRDDRFKGIFPVGQKGWFGFEVTTADDQPVDDRAAYSAASLAKTLEVAKGQARFRD